MCAGACRNYYSVSHPVTVSCQALYPATLSSRRVIRRGSICHTLIKRSLSAMNGKGSALPAIGGRLLQHQASCAAVGPHEKIPGRRGRPPGSKNKRTLAMESLAQQGLTAGQQQAAMALLKQRAEQKRQEDEENLQAAIACGQKRRGRPPGSRNRPRDDGKTV